MTSGIKRRVNSVASANAPTPARHNIGDWWSPTGGGAPSVVGFADDGSAQFYQMLDSTLVQSGRATMAGNPGTIEVTNVTNPGLVLNAADEIVYSRTTLVGAAGHVAISARTNGAAGVAKFTLLSAGNEQSVFSFHIIRGTI